jgi:CRP-like cAMP-binding protein
LTPREKKTPREHKTTREDSTAEDLTTEDLTSGRDAPGGQPAAPSALRLGPGDAFGQCCLAVPRSVPCTLLRDVVVRSECAVMCALPRDAILAIDGVSADCSRMLVKLLRPERGLRDWLHVESRHEEKVAKFDLLGEGDSEFDHLARRKEHTRVQRALKRSERRHVEGRTRMRGPGVFAGGGRRR